MRPRYYRFQLRFCGPYGLGLRHIVLSMNTRKWISLQDKHRAEHDIPITLAKLKTPNRSESDNIVKKQPGRFTVKPTRNCYYLTMTFSNGTYSDSSSFLYRDALHKREESKRQQNYHRSIIIINVRSQLIGKIKPQRCSTFYQKHLLTLPFKNAFCRRAPDLL